MTYPTLERYQEALQYPVNTFIDPELKQASIKATGLGMPLALCGGFALTYTATSGMKRYAVRCFHKESKALEARYMAISKRLLALNSPYFLDFSFQPQGVKIDQKVYPVVKMAWASGETLGEFLEKNYRNKAVISTLRQSLSALANYLDQQRISHGDIQTGNVMVTDGGKRIQLIDYDGMFVDEIRGLGSSELGHRNFQHPDRAASNPYDQTLDRFSFISLTLALRALEEDSSLWTKSRSDIDGIIFRAGDFQAPESSAIFNALSKSSTLEQDIKNFAAICKAPFASIPSLADFLIQKNLPSLAVTLTGLTSSVTLRSYLAAYTVLSGSDFTHCLRHVGDRVELIGKIIEVKENRTRGGKPYVFLNFGPWKGKTVKISIWSEGLHALTQKPDQSWVGKWISVVGLMESPYESTKYQYTHLAITVTKNNEMSFIDDMEAQYRMAGSRMAPPSRSASSNGDILNKINPQTSVATHRSPATTSVTPPIPKSANQVLLDKIKQNTTQPSQNIPPHRSTPAQHGTPPHRITPVQHGTQPHWSKPPPKIERGLLGSIYDFFFK